MFTGIITDLATIRAIHRGGDTRIEIATGYDTAGIALGASIACAGVCLTVVDKGRGWFATSVSAETLARTTIGGWRQGKRINLERSLKIGDELGGHLVFGHVDGIGEIGSIAADGDSRRMQIIAPAPLMRFFAVKGSVAVDGVSLTINEVDRHRFGVNLIPHTRAGTSLGEAGAGDAVNLEIDMLARYVARLLERD
jgi:riboflavin synthase